ncbi:hypothetical protein PLICRDRAFT_105367 [Plicaturopsis crispa FD-325 SS-3]|nr:hypothetical protein PLICRDRAFT_105367 [Plicaturopsis crispa FD-325 SS-3]
MPSFAVYKKRKVGDKLEVQIGKKPDNEGVLSVLIDLPLDIFFEVCTVLHPVDILQLSRVSKEFRSLFMSRNSRHVWVAARRNAPGVPDCPPDMTEGQYARLLFEHDCYACGKPIAKMLDYALRLRYCGDCFKTKFVSP